MKQNLGLFLFVVQESMEETLTLHKLGITGTLRKTLQSTNLIESAISGVRNVTRKVKRCAIVEKGTQKRHAFSRQRSCKLGSSFLK